MRGQGLDTNIIIPPPPNAEASKRHKHHSFHNRLMSRQLVSISLFPCQPKGDKAHHVSLSR